MPLKQRQAWGIRHLSRKPVPGFDHPLGKEVLPNVQSKETMDYKDFNTLFPIYM